MLVWILTVFRTTQLVGARHAKFNHFKVLHIVESIPRHSMYCIFTYIEVVSGVNVYICKYAIHAIHGVFEICCFLKFGFTFAFERSTRTYTQGQTNAVLRSFAYYFVSIWLVRCVSKSGPRRKAPTVGIHQSASTPITVTFGRPWGILKGCFGGGASLDVSP